MRTSNSKGSHVHSVNDASEVRGVSRWSYIGMRRRVRDVVAPPRGGNKTSKRFDTFIVTLILLNVLAMIVESVKRVHEAIPGYFLAFEYFAVAVFTVEY